MTATSYYTIKRNPNGDYVAVKQAPSVNPGVEENPIPDSSKGE